MGSDPPAAGAREGIWPIELRLLADRRALAVTFTPAEKHVITAELLRVESPSAEVKGHGPGQEQLQWGKRDVTITKLEPVGNYAIRLTFSDGHSTGIYTWDYLARLGRDGEAILAAHLAKLKAAGLPR